VFQIFTATKITNPQFLCVPLDFLENNPYLCPRSTLQPSISFCFHQETYTVECLSCCRVSSSNPRKVITSKESTKPLQREDLEGLHSLLPPRFPCVYWNLYSFYCAWREEYRLFKPELELPQPCIWLRGLRNMEGWDYMYATTPSRHVRNGLQNPCHRFDCQRLTNFWRFWLYIVVCNISY